ncbi:hypothetical protein [Kitasatospora cheerisanensis]|uniref:Uncharacterized protein n=1 Tax=Kitasatospora cheerisanensis KCTC 2395 TaxID=1348663 RepID=A0A066YWY4_9ACTN|nr:hypothetical protein [Kitasatospora cheerisanensis]KDN82601.1 hypothetical protein KCH_55160 [Kitasatospora cheerisanensis KCTC 2395]
MAEESVVELVLTAALLTLGLLVARDFRGWIRRIHEFGGASPERIRLGGVLLVLLALLWSVEPITRLLH